MRYYLDTNMLVFILSDSDSDDISREVYDIITDYSNMLYASSVAVNELVLLYKIGKVGLEDCKSVKDIIPGMKRYGIEIVYYNQYHLEKYIALDLADGHKDMNDHAIIAQAIVDKIPLVSSDTKFHCYTGQGLDFVFNRR
ncbi:PIN domain protein [Bacteroidales bacterium Barb6XT]|nr:PIN domain protein [Bacteroidales bacterium Barb6XT]